MAEEPRKLPLWEFADSPFTWGGIGVIVGAALVSPSLFKWAFVGAGVSIGIGWLRAGSLRGSRGTIRIGGNVAMLGALAIIWFGVWKIIPKPVEPPTAEQIAEAVVGKTNQNIKPSAPIQLPKSASADEIAASIVGRLPKAASTLDLSNGDLKAQAKNVAEQIQKQLQPAVKEYFAIELDNSLSRQEKTFRQKQLEDDFMGHEENKLLFAKADYLRDAVLAKLGRPPLRDKMFTVWPGSTGGVVAEQLNQLASELP
jgi:hypothetical protein